jgi:1-acyl-sn-glycerol-3-phosphate acyltransferase
VRAFSSIATFLRTCVGLVVLPIGLALYSSAAILRALLGAPAARVHRCYVGFARLCVRVGGTELMLQGADRIAAGESYVVVVNHESTWDPVCVVTALPDLLLRFVAKGQLMRIPIFGTALGLTGNVRVERSKTAGDVSRLREGMERRDPAVSLLFFAEGTRSRDGSFRPFRMGAFATALASELPVLPIAVAGTYAIWPKGTLRLRRRPVAIEVGEPISTAGMKFEDRGALCDRAHAVMGELRAAARRRLRASGSEPGGID